jgi:3-keto-5-aminohexanoate cleavage enzyme
MPTWDPTSPPPSHDAIKAACPDLIFNMTTGVVGDDISGPLACLHAIRPEIAACNAGSLNYFKAKSDGTWAWPPHALRQPRAQGRGLPAGHEGVRHRARVRVLRPRHRPLRRPLRRRRPRPQPPLQLRHGRRLRHALRPRAAPLPPQATSSPAAAGRSPPSAARRSGPSTSRAAELGGDLRTGLEDTFYLPDGDARRPATASSSRRSSPAPARPAARSPAPPRPASCSASPAKPPADAVPPAPQGPQLSAPRPPSPRSYIHRVPPGAAGGDNLPLA